MWFGIGNGQTRFSKKEFCLITDLRFDTLSSIFNEEYVSVVVKSMKIFLKLDDVKANALWSRFK